MLDVGPGGAQRAASGGDAEDLLVFVERVAAAGAAEPATTAARTRIARTIAAGDVPPGLRRLAEALAASVGELPPGPRHPVDDAAAVVPAMLSNALVVLENADDAAVAAAVSALVTDGRRVVVTAETDALLDTVRVELASDHALDGLPPLPPAELRELRRLLATSTVTARSRSGQQLPHPDALPALDTVTDLCARATRSGAVDGSTMIPALMADIDAERRAAVTSVARCVTARLEALAPQPHWAWRLLGHLIHTRHRPAFDRVCEDLAQAATVAERLRGAALVTFRGLISSAAIDLMCSYLGFLESGGRARAYFRPSIQREVQPALRLVRVGDRVPQTNTEIRVVLDQLQLDERLARINAGCTEMGVPLPTGPHELAPLAGQLGLVAAAARSVGALRHDVLFLAADSPVAVPDVESAAGIAAAVLDYADHGSPDQAAGKLDAMAGGLASLVPVTATAPEHDRAVAALRSRDAAGYADALDALARARRELRDDDRRVELLDRLRAAVPSLAAAWEADGDPRGLACFLRAEVLLGAVPPPDTADVVVVLGASTLGVQRLLLTAVAPRMVAVVAPDEEPEGSPTLLSVLRRAAALVIRGRAAEPRASGRVVALASAHRSSGPPRDGVAAVGQAGA